jgi:hypothetical protein
MNFLTLRGLSFGLLQIEPRETSCRKGRLILEEYILSCGLQSFRVLHLASASEEEILEDILVVKGLKESPELRKRRRFSHCFVMVQNWCENMLPDEKHVMHHGVA